MGFATSNRTDLKFVKEVTWGQTPATPTLQQMRYTGESLDDAITTEKSKEIRSDRMVADLTVTDAQVSGDINFEMSYGTYDALFESAFMSTWSAALAIAGIAADISTTAGGLSSSLVSKFTAITVGQVIRLSGFTNPLNNGYFRVTAKASNQLLTLSPAPGSIETPTGTLANISGGGSIKNGLTEQSYTLVEVFNDANVVTYRRFLGMRVKAWSLDMKTAALLTGKFSFMGQSASYSTSAIAGETTTAATTTDVMNCVTSIGVIMQNNAQMGTIGSMMSLTLDFDNQHRGQKGLAFLGNVGVVASQLSAKGTASLYFETKAQADLFKASTRFSFSISLKDAAGNGYTFTFPSCKYDTFKVNSNQLDSDVMAQCTFQALLDPITNCMVQMDRFVGP